jgi:proteasome lid subunit RPN8/RPN11
LVIFVHSHPSGDPELSVADKELTPKLVRAGQMMGIQVRAPFSKRARQMAFRTWLESGFQKAR